MKINLSFNRTWRSMLILLVVATIQLFFIRCDFKKSDDAGGSYVYVKPSIDYRGRMRKGHMRKKVSTDKNAIKNRNRSRYYYHTRGKYRRKKK